MVGYLVTLSWSHSVVVSVVAAIVILFGSGMCMERIWNRLNRSRRHRKWFDPDPWRDREI
ncbi:MAG TPA: hypothetical protein VGP79_12520 [Bryobacteraceae bacterium]|nr:hypothetical protein [Bryobacteraceae bacterium]